MSDDTDGTDSTHDADSPDEPLSEGATFDAPDDPVAEKSHEAGRVLGDSIRLIGTVIWFFLGGIGKHIVVVVTRFLPYFGTKWWKFLSVFAFNTYFKRVSGSPDVIGLITEEDTQVIRFAPARLEYGLEEIEDEAGWNVLGEDRYWKRSAHPEIFRIGKVPVVWFDRDSIRAGSPLESRVTEAIDAGDMRELYNVEQAEITARIDYPDAMGGQAVADGGEDYTIRRDFNWKEAPIFEDMLIDVSAGEGFAGRALSFTHYNDHAPHETDPEELVKAEQRGWLAGLAGGDRTGFILKVMLIAAGIVLGTLAIVLLGPRLLSQGAQGGGGGIIPPGLFATVWGLL